MPCSRPRRRTSLEDGASKSGARLRLDAALEGVEDCHVAGLQVRRAVRRDEAQYDVRKLRLHGDHGGLGGADAGMSQRRIHDCPSLPGFSTSSRAVVSCRIVVVVAQPFSDVMSVLWPGLLRQDGVCLVRVHDVHQHVQLNTVHAEGDRECRVAL